MNKTPRWAFYTLLLAGFYNLIWGAWVILFPKLSFTLLGVEPANPIEIWQCVGMIVGVYGFGYLIAATDPNRHWPIVLVGFLGKIFGPIGFSKALITGVFPLSFGINIIFNDIIWWIPFYLLLKNAYLFHNDNSKIRKKPLGDFLDKNDKTLLIALRHIGCTFTRENLQNISEERHKIEKENWKIKFVHMGEDKEFKAFLVKYSLSSSLTESDPDREIYKKLGLSKAGLKQVFGLKVFIKGIKAFFKGHGLGPLRGDGFQLGGMFLFEGHKELKSFKSKDASDTFPIKEWLS